RPEFKSAYLNEYGFLRPRLRRNATIDYWDFREDLSSYERLFTGHQDEFFAMPRSADGVPSLLVPLRTGEGRITATVNLRSPAPAARRHALREILAFGALTALASALFLFLLGSLFVPSFYRDRRPASAVVAVAALIAFRAVIFPLSRLGPAATSPLFSPDRAGFASWGDLTRSPFEIFLTALVLFGLAIGLTHILTFPRASKRTVLLLFVPPLLLAGATTVIERLVVHSNIHLLRFIPSVPLFLLHASILLFVAAAVVPSMVVLKKTFDRRNGALPLIFALTAATAILLFLLRPSAPLRNLALAAGLGLAAAVFSLPPGSGRKAAAGLAIFAGSLGIFAAILKTTDFKSRALARSYLRETIQTRDFWAGFLLDESMKELERSKKKIISLLREPSASSDLAHRLWSETPAARFNWYSGLEIHDPEGTILSRFALNVPKIFSLAAGLPVRPEGGVVRLPLPFLGKQKEFLVGYRDWLDDGRPLGRTLFYVSLDDDLLPFLHSANPYFELLRSNSLPSLVQFDFRFAIFDAAGRVTFNPDNLSTGFPDALLGRPALDEDGLWAAFRDNGADFNLYAFRNEGRIYAILTPRPTLIGRTVEYFKFFTLMAAFLAPFFFIRWLRSARVGRPRPFWSFADRVYVSFAAVALVPLLVFALLSPQFFNRVFAQQFIRKAAAQATLARNVMDDFVYLQKEEEDAVQTPPEDLVLWISTTTANDVNLYQNGRLVSSSRRELFDSGLLPELLDGEIQYRIEFENHPYYARTQRLGTFSYRTLTVPYAGVDPTLLISLPFPLEQQEISAAGRDLFEFLVFIGFFFVGFVLLLARGIGAMIVTPIRRLLAGTREAALGNLEVEVEYRGGDEMKTLVDGFNGMIRSLKNHQQEMADLGRKAAWADMARKVAHEIKNPLTPIQLSAEHLLHVWQDRREDFESALKESISYIVGEVENLRCIAQEFLDLSRAAVLNKETVALDEILAETVGPYQKLLAARLSFVTAIEPGLRFEGDRGKLKIAFRNLMINAIESIRNRGEIKVEAGRTGDRYRIIIADDGSGMEPDVVERIFEPYFSTKTSGTGLGLPITRKIVEDHGGTIRIQSEPRRGTVVTIEFPAGTR
ncbi:MAG: sensor histidine kinase, partial [Candidatus Aminicenantales bacterium]